MFRFSIRELLLLTVIVALGAGWAIDNRIKVATIETLRQLVKASLKDLAGKYGHGTDVILPDGEILRATGDDAPTIQGRG